MVIRKLKETGAGARSGGETTLRAIDKALSRLSWGLMSVGICIAILMALHIVIDVLAKFLFNFPLAGTLEIVANYYMVGLIFMPLAHIQRADGHIAADLFVNLLNPDVRRYLNAFVMFSMAAFAALLVWRSSVEALRSFSYLEAIQTSGYFVYVFPARWLIPIGFGAMGFCALAQFFKLALDIRQRA